MDRRHRPGLLWGLAGLVALTIAGIFLAVLLLPSLLFGDVSKASSDARLQASTGVQTAFVALLVGLSGLVGLVLNTRIFRLAQQGQISDRYTRAIEQLGSDKLELRLGGIFALERIARDSAADHASVVEVLSAFVREHIGSVSSLIERFEEGSLRGAPPRNPKPTIDVRAALTVLGRLPYLPGVDRADLSYGEFAVGLPRFDGQGWWLGQATWVRASLRVAVSNSSGVR
jgi:hypothetical protein